MGQDRSPQRVILSVKKKKVRYYHRVVTFRKTRSERTTRRKKKVGIQVDVSQPAQPYVEPKCCVKLAVHHGVAAFYTNYVLKCDATCYCNELCDFVCGRTSHFNNDKVASSMANPDDAPPVARPKAMSCDSGFDEASGGCGSEDDESPPRDREFVNIDVGHRSVWFCRSSPPGPDDLEVVRSSLHQIQSESATETECSGPSRLLCFRWHKDLERSSNALRAKRKKAKDEEGTNSAVAPSPRHRRRDKNASAPSLRRPIPGRGDLAASDGEGAVRRSKRNAALRSKLPPALDADFPPTLSSSLPPDLGSQFPADFQCESSGSVAGDDVDALSDYDSGRDAQDERWPLALDETYSSVLATIRSMNKEARRSRSFRLDVTQPT